MLRDISGYMPSAIYWVTVGRIVLLRIRGFGKDVGSCFLRISHLMSNVLCLQIRGFGKEVRVQPLRFF